MLVRYFDDTEKTYKVIVAARVYLAGEYMVIERTPSNLILVHRNHFIEARWL